MTGKDAFMHRLLKITLMLLLCFGGPAWAAGEALVLTEAGFQDLEGHLSLWRDGSKAATLEEALAAQEAGAFSPIPGNLGLGYVPEAAWLAFSVVVPEGLRSAAGLS